MFILELHLYTHLLFLCHNFVKLGNNVVPIAEHTPFGL